MLKTILLTIAFIFLIESFILLFFPKQINKLLKKILKDNKFLRKLAFLEIICGLILILISFII